jgi:hypothetical protein
MLKEMVQQYLYSHVPLALMCIQVLKQLVQDTLFDVDDLVSFIGWHDSVRVTI